MRRVRAVDFRDSGFMSLGYLARPEEQPESLTILNSGRAALTIFLPQVRR